MMRITLPQRASLPAAMLGSFLLATTAVAQVSSSTTRSTVNVSGASSTTASSVLQDYDNEIMLGVFPASSIASLTVRIRAYPDYGPDDAYCVFFGPGSERAGFHGEQTFSFATLPGGELDRSQVVMICSYYTHEPHGPLNTNDFGISVLEAKNSAGKPVPVQVCILDFDEDGVHEPAADECRFACGDVVCDGGEPTVTDALATLRRVVNLDTCISELCDADHDEEIDTTDALRVLKRAVGLRVNLLCRSDVCLH